MKRVAGYIRVSTDEQASEGHSIANQVARIEAYALSQGWKMTDKFIDEGFSGKSVERPGLQELLSLVTESEIDIVLVYKVDRLTRRQRDLWMLLEDVFEPNNVGLKSVSESFDTTTATGKAFLSMIGTFAQLERDTVSERTRDALAGKKAKGEWSGRIPFGYKLTHNGYLERDEDQQLKIARIKRLRRQGLSLREIARREMIGKSTVARLLKEHVKARNSQYLNS